MRFPASRDDARRLGMTGRLMPLVAAGLFGALLFAAGLVHHRIGEIDKETRDRQRAAVMAALNELRPDVAELFARAEVETARDAPAAETVSPAQLTRLLVAVERLAGVEDLSFDASDTQPGRESHPITDAQGRIRGWLSWKAIHPARDALLRLAPPLGIVALASLAFMGLALGYARRAKRLLRLSEARVRELRDQDALTHLCSRPKLIEVLDEALAARKADETVTFVFLDLDRFREVNETFGQEVGDRLLMAVADRLKAALPASAVIGRMGDDGFAIVLTGEAPSSAIQAAEAAHATLSRPFAMGEQTVQISVSVGVAHAPRDGTRRDELARRAYLAMRSVKQNGRGGLAGFAPAFEQKYQDRLFIKQELRRALDERGLAVHYQPIVASDGQRIVGVEALLRWHHPTRGDIPPALFIPIAEQAGLMGRLGAFVLRRALNDAVQWDDVYVAVNLSPIQVRDRGFNAFVAQMLKETGLPASRLVLEITEGVLMEDPLEAKACLEQLRALGVKIALDDFGSGYSSLAYLRRFPIDKLKIDKEFVAPLGRASEAGVILQAIIALGRALGLSVLCEGVETEEQRILLRLAGCDEMQGYLFARPVPRSVIDKLMAHGNAHGGLPRLPAVHRAGPPQASQI